MRLNHVNILNYKNIEEVRLDFADGLNCLIGDNGMGKTNVLDAIYYLSFCKSYATVTDQSVIMHDAPFMMLQGSYVRRDQTEDITVSMQRGQRKIVKRGGKAYQRLSQHIGLLPLVMVTPMDWDLIRGTGAERRRLMDQIISQSDAAYLDALINYTHALEQRNAMIRREMHDALLYATVEQTLDHTAAVIHAARRRWVDEFTPIFMDYYSAVAGDREQVSLAYQSHLDEAPLQQLLDATRERDMVIGHTTRGVHRDDLVMTLNGQPMRATGSQGQCKTYTIALRLAQYDFLRKCMNITPLLLLDDIFDKLDATRVEHIIEVVASDRFGQIFITDTNRTHLDQIVSRTAGEHRMFHVDHGHCHPVEHNAES